MMNTRTLVALLALLAAAMGAPAASEAVEYTAPNSQEETITVSNSAIGITSSVCLGVDGTRKPAVVQVKVQGIYFSLHSASATPDSGDFEAVAGDVFKFSRTEVAKLRMIRSGGADATAKVQCYD